MNQVNLTMPTPNSQSEQENEEEEEEDPSTYKNMSIKEIDIKQFQINSGIGTFGNQSK